MMTKDQVTTSAEGEELVSLRDRFAGQALSKLIPEDWEVSPGSYRKQIHNISHWAYEFADAMLEARGTPELSDLLWFAKQIFNGLDTGMLRFETPADETLKNILDRGRSAIAKAEGTVPEFPPNREIRDGEGEA